MSFKGFTVGVQNDSEKIKQLVLQSKQIADDLALLESQINKLSSTNNVSSGGLPVVGEDSESYSLDLVNCTSLYPLVIDKNKRKIQSAETVPYADEAGDADTLDGISSAGFVKVPTKIGTEQTIINAVTTASGGTTDHAIPLPSLDTAYGTVSGGQYYILKISCQTTFSGNSSALATWRFTSGATAGASDPILAQLTNGGSYSAKTFEIIVPFGRYVMRCTAATGCTATTTIKAKQLNTRILYGSL